MDLQGSLVDTSLRIYASNKLKLFLLNEKFGKNVPVNITKLIKGEISNSKVNRKDSKPLNVYLDKDDIEMLVKIKDNLNCDDVTNCENGNDETDVSETNNKQCEKKDDEIKADAKINEDCQEAKVGFLTTTDIDWLYTYIKDKRNRGGDIPYLHELLEGSNIELPENSVIKRNPVLEARCVKLRAQQEAREYRKMTKGVDNVRMRFPEDSISYQLKQMNRQLIAIGQFIISIFAGFLFGFRGVEWMVGNLDFGFRLLLGVMCALIIALAEIYFLAKKLNEELSVPETTQLGGPPTFADERFNGNKISKPVDKPHQD